MLASTLSVVLFAAALPNDWYLTNHSARDVDVFRNLRLNATVWAYHGSEEIRLSYRPSLIYVWRALAQQNGHVCAPVARMCADQSAVAYTQWSPKRDTVQVAVRNVELGGEVVTLFFRGQWPWYASLTAPRDFAQIVCSGWVWNKAY